MDSSLPPTLVVGLGHTGTWLARALHHRGVTVVGTTRDGEKARRLYAEGIDARLADLEDPESLSGLCPEGGAVVHTAPPLVGPDGRDRGARNVLQAVRAARPGVLVYYSTTGVYTESSGGPVDEDAPVDTEGARSAPRLDAERAFLDAAAEWGATGVAFRLAGIYGRGRGLAERLRQGRVRLWGGGHNLLNRIHVDDIVRFTLAALASGPERSGVYNLADDRPASLREYALWLADRLGVPPPPEAPAGDAPSPTLLGSKRVSNARAKATFGLELVRPDYRSGFDDGDEASG